MKRLWILLLLVFMIACEKEKSDGTLTDDQKEVVEAAVKTTALVSQVDDEFSDNEEITSENGYNGASDESDYTASAIIKDISDEHLMKSSSSFTFVGRDTITRNYPDGTQATIIRVFDPTTLRLTSIDVSTKNFPNSSRVEKKFYRATFTYDPNVIITQNTVMTSSFKDSTIIKTYEDYPGFTQITSGTIIRNVGRVKFADRKLSYSATTTGFATVSGISNRVMSISIDPVGGTSHKETTTNYTDASSSTSEITYTRTVNATTGERTLSGTMDITLRDGTHRYSISTMNITADSSNLSKSGTIQIQTDFPAGDSLYRKITKVIMNGAVSTDSSTFYFLDGTTYSTVLNITRTSAPTGNGTPEGLSYTITGSDSRGRTLNATVTGKRYNFETTGTITESDGSTSQFTLIRDGSSVTLTFTITKTDAALSSTGSFVFDLQNKTGGGTITNGDITMVYVFTGMCEGYYYPENHEDLKQDIEGCMFSLLKL